MDNYAREVSDLTTQGFQCKFCLDQMNPRGVS